MIQHQHLQDVMQVEGRIAGHLKGHEHDGHRKHEHHAEIVSELHRLQADDIAHHRNFHRDLDLINSRLHQEHLPQISMDGKSFHIKPFRSDSEETGEPHTRHFMSTVRHSIGEHRQAMRGRHSNEGQFATPEDMADGTHRRSNFHGHSDAAPSKTGFAKALLAKLGLPDTEQNEQFLDAWQKAEGGDAFNPFNTTQRWNNAQSINRAGVKEYASFEDGVNATAKTLQYGYYRNIVAALRSGNDAQNAAIALAHTPWGTGNGAEQVLRQA